MTPENNNRLQEIHSSKTNKLDEYLSSELKLQESINNKLNDPNLKELAKKEITDINNTSYFGFQK